MEISELEILRLNAEQFPMSIFITSVLFMIGNLLIVLINRSKKEFNVIFTLISMLLLFSPSMLMHEYGGKNLSGLFIFVNTVYAYGFIFIQPKVSAEKK